MVKQDTNNERSLAAAEAAPRNEQRNSHHLHIVFVVDTTGSMHVYLTALRRALCQVSALLQVMFPSSADVSVLTYKDYGDGKGVFRKVIKGSYQQLSKFCSDLMVGGGGDIAEASKTALNYLSTMIKAWKEDTFIVFHYTDAPPHHRLTNPHGSNRGKEQKALEGQKPGYDWCKISKRFRRNADRVKLFTIAPEDSPAGMWGSAFYALLGELIVLKNISAQSITQTTMSILLQLIGQEAETGTGQRVCFRRQEQVMERLFTDDYNEDNFPELNTDECKEPTIHEAKRNIDDLSWSEGFDFEAVPHIAMTDLSKLRTCFKEDTEFRNIVFQVMSDLIKPESVMALTTNAIFGRLWRLVCNSREDPRLGPLVSKMGECAGSKLLSDKERSALKIWIEESYDYAEEMNAKIKAQRNCKSFYVLDAFSNDYLPTVDGLRSLGRSPSPDALANLQKILSHIMLVHIEDTGELPEDEDGNCRYLPHDMDDYLVFTMLPHLIQAGTQYSLKPAAVLAIVCCKSANSLLQERACRFLVSIRGKWLPSVERIDRAEIISYEFSSLIANCQVEGAFNSDEREFFRRLHEIWRYRRGRFTNFDVVTHISPTKPMLLPDIKEKCRSCNEWTSKSLMDCNKECGICLWMSESAENVWQRPQQGEEYFVNECESYMVECIACHTMYAVLGPGDLNVPPKCHYCRGLDHKRRACDGAPYHRCACCRAKWSDPSLDMNDESGRFVCPVCEFGGATSVSSPVPDVCKTTHTVSLNEVMQSNPEWITVLGFRKKAASIIFSGCKIYQAIVDNRSALFLPPRQNTTTPPLNHKGKIVLNQDKLLNNVKVAIASATFVGTCQLCFSELAVEELRLACGGCTNRCCRTCLQSWYQQNAPGALFIPCHDMCPFCRQRPRYTVLSQYNHQACAIVGLSRRKGKELRLRADWYYGWCIQCWKIGFAMERRCSEGVPSLTDFVC